VICGSHQSASFSNENTAAGTGHADMPEGCAKIMINRIFCITFLLSCAFITSAAAQPSKPYRVGVILPGGAQYTTLEGFRQGLRDLGLEEGKHIALTIKDVKGETSAADAAAGDLEKGNASLIYALTTPVVTKTKSATAKIPVVFSLGSDPVTGGLVESFAKPGGRLTGVHYLVRDLTAKRLEVLKEVMPRLARVLTYYDPANRVAVEGASLAREGAKRLGIKLIEIHISSVEDLKKKLDALRIGAADAFLFTADPLIGSHSQLVIDTAKSKKLPAMFQEQSLAAKGALVSYGQNYYDIGRLAAKYAQRIIKGDHPKDLKIETVDTVELVINLKTAKELGLKIPPAVLARADKVIK